MSKKEKRPGIYALISPSGKAYVGLDSAMPNRANTHLNGKDPLCRGIHQAVLKYGGDAFNVELYDFPCASLPELCALEQWYIRVYDSFENGYNLSMGGEGNLGHKHTLKTRNQMSVSAMGRKHTLEFIEWLSDVRTGEGNPHYGKPRPEETKRKIAKGNIGKNKGKYDGENNPMSRDNIKRRSGAIQLKLFEGEKE